DCTFDDSVNIRFEGNPGLSGSADDIWIDGITITGQGVQKLPSNISLTLNASENNLTLQQGESTIISCSKITADPNGIIQLYKQGTLINQGTSTIQNLTTFNSPGQENITCIYLRSENYESSSKILFVNTTANQPPLTPTPTIRTLNGQNTSSENLYCEDTVIDPEANEMNITLNWYKNDSLFKTEQFNSYPNATLLQSIIDSKNTSNADLWKCELQIFDNFGSTPKTNSSTLTISDPVITPTPGSCSDFWGFDCSTGPPETGGNNTFDSCSTGTGNDESIEDIMLNTTIITPGESINVTCTVDPYTSNDDTFIWYYNGTGWRKIFENLNWGSSSIVNESAVFTPDPVIGTHWVRCGIVYTTGSDTDECMDTGSYYDNDDMSFNVTLPPNKIPTITSIETISPQSITESGTTAVTFSYQVTDLDETTDLNDTTAYAEFRKAGEETRSAACTKSNNINTTTANYTCTIDMWYFDAAGDWIIKVSINDSETYTEDLSTSFILGQTTAMVFSPSSVSFSGATSPADTNILADQRITINNTGNDPIDAGEIKIQATNLLGETDNSIGIYAENFTAHTAAACDIGPQMQNNSQTAILTATLSTGNFSINDGTAQEEIFYCLEALNPNLTAQTYSTNETGAWTITLLLAAIKIATKKKKKERKKKNLANILTEKEKLL
ncbi:MAG: hypothetical protein MI922_16775, partial [Bacteroidales bacterium]|nr:hypothetical protein [Bacteroidales bacterium]